MEMSTGPFFDIYSQSCTTMSFPSDDQNVPFQGIYRVTFSAKRRSGVTKEEFSRRFALHGQKAGLVVVKHNGISYVQVWSIRETRHTHLISTQNHLPDSHAVALKENLGPEIAQHLNFVDTDGITTLVFPTVDDLANFFRDPAHGESLNADVAEFANVSTVSISLGDDLVVVEKGRVMV